MLRLAYQTIWFLLIATFATCGTLSAASDDIAPLPGATLEQPLAADGLMGGDSLADDDGMGNGQHPHRVDTNCRRSCLASMSLRQATGRPDTNTRTFIWPETVPARWISLISRCSISWGRFRPVFRA